MASLIPFELIEEILYRIPIKSLIRFKTVCKQWRALFNNDKRFIYKHLDKFSHTGLIEIYPDLIQIINHVTLDIINIIVPDEVYLDKRIDSIIHCDGLLLCHCLVSREHFKLAIWSPILSQFYCIDSSRSHRSFDLLGFGYDNVSRESYKILSVVDFKSSNFEIFDLKSKVWTKFHNNFDWSIFEPFQQKVSMKGNMYWIAKRNDEKFIQSFDFSSNTFKPICSFPLVIKFYSIQYSMVTLGGYRGDRLSFLYHKFKANEIEMWMTNKVTDEVVSWSKYLTVTSRDLPIIHPFTSSCGHPTHYMDHETDSIMLWCDKVVEEKKACATFYEIGEGKIKREVEIGNTYEVTWHYMKAYFSSSVYIPSMVPIPE